MSDKYHGDTNSARSEMQFSKGVATNIDEAVAEIERLRAENAHLQFCLNSRDDFLVRIDRWSAYTDTLPHGKAGVPGGWSDQPCTSGGGRDARKWPYELAFWAMGAIGFIAIVWIGYRNENVQFQIAAGIERISSTLEHHRCP